MASNDVVNCRPMNISNFLEVAHNNRLLTFAFQYYFYEWLYGKKFLSSIGACKKWMFVTLKYSVGAISPECEILSAIFHSFHILAILHWKFGVFSI